MPYNGTSRTLSPTAKPTIKYPIVGGGVPDAPSYRVSGYPENFSGYPENFLGYPENFLGYPENFLGYPENFSGYPENFSGYPENHPASPVETHGRASHPASAIYPSSARARHALPNALKGQHTPAQGNALGIMDVMGTTTMPYIENEYPGRCPGLGYAAPSGLQSPRRGETRSIASLRAMPSFCLNYDWNDLYDLHDSLDALSHTDDVSHNSLDALSHQENHVHHINHSNHSSDNSSTLKKNIQ
jgi:hypothetical protein